jgi:Carboxypeptidase regulatory-like domain
MATSRLLVLAALMQLGLSWLVLAQAPAVEKFADWATVTGRVVDASGRPVVGARISMMPLDVAVNGGMPREPITNQEGRYRLVSPAYPGRTRLCAVKENAGYPNTQYLLFASGKETMPEVHLTPGGQFDGVDIRLDPPDGTVEGSVVDATTHEPVPKARITLRRSNPESISSSSLPPDGHFFYALPPAPIEISVDAPGYRRWSYRDKTNGANWLVIDTSDHRKITVELRPN